ncbi:MAG: ATP-binding cassette domain-containing protein [Nitrospinae bacterium]|nr:ATP-binding cassette domain-containing protein [Nitrospinota bacterium]
MKEALGKDKVSVERRRHGVALPERGADFSAALGQFCVVKTYRNSPIGIPFEKNWNHRGEQFVFVPLANVVQNISLEVEPGQRIAFVGRSGSGKSTLIKLLYGFYPLTSGKLYVDGFSLSDVRLSSLRRQIGVVPQQSYLFSGTIRENIAKSKPGAPLSEIIEAAKLAAAHDFITAFPKNITWL